MTNKNIKRRYNKTLKLSLKSDYNKNYYSGGGFKDINNNGKIGWGEKSSQIAKQAWSGENIGNSIAAVTEGVSSIMDSSLQNAQIADTTEIESGIQETKNTEFGLDKSSFLDNLSNFDYAKNDYTWKDVRGLSAAEGIGNTLSAIGSGAAAGGSVGGPWGCVCAGTRVVTKDGKFLNIENLSNKDGIIGYSNNSICINSINLNIGKAYKLCVKITFNNGNTLKCSTDHPIYTASKGKAKRKIVSGIRYREKVYLYKPASELKVGDNVAEIDSIPIFGTINEPDAYLIGMLIGDGTYGKKHGVRLFTADSDTWNYIESKYPTSYYVKDNTGKYTKEFREYRFNKFDKLHRLGLYGQTKKNKRLPENIYLWNKTSVASLIAGLYDTDGYITIESTGKFRIAFCQSNINLINEVKEQLLKFGIHSYIKTNPKKSTTYKEYSINSDISYVLIVKDILSALRFIDNIPLNISYKKNNLHKIKEIIFSKNRRDNSYLQGIKSIKVTSIEDIGIQRIYNLEALNSHNYIANNIITHNSIAGAAVGLGSAIAGIFTGKRKAKNKAAELNRLANLANYQADVNKFNSFELINNNDYFNNMSALAAYGGRLYNRNHYGNGGFGFVGNIEDSNNKKEFGGTMNTHGGYFSNDIIKVDEGGTHEENPYEGVPMGIAPDGHPNLVEEGEVIFNDYVFSNRLHLSEKELDQNKFPKKYKGYTFALAAEDISKESSERPNDPISKRGLEDSLNKLALLQEQQRMKKGKKGTQQMMAYGGHKFEGAKDTILKSTLDEITKSINIPEENFNIENSPISFTKTDPYFVPFANKKGKLRNRGVWVDERGNRKGKKYSNPHDDNYLSTSLRYAPIVGSAIGALSSVLEKPDYTNSNLILDAANNLSKDRVSSRPINNYLTYKPLDRNYYLSKLQEQANATRAALRNSGGNSGQVMAGLLAADYNAQNAVGDTLMKMDMYNEQQRQAVEQFNRGTNQYNSQVAMNADAQNAQLAQARDNMRLSGITTAANMRELADTALATSRSANFTNFFDNLGAIGRENRDTNMLQAMIDSDLFGTLSESMKRGWNKNGGMLTKRSRRRK